MSDIRISIPATTIDQAALQALHDALGKVTGLEIVVEAPDSTMWVEIYGR